MLAFWGKLSVAQQGPCSCSRFTFFLFPSLSLFSQINILAIAKSHTGKVYQYFGRDVSNVFAMKSMRGSKLAGHLMGERMYFFSLAAQLALKFLYKKADAE